MNIIEPLNKKVVVMPEEAEKVSKGGIVIPESANQKAPTRGRVISIDSDSALNAKIKPGDVILFSKYAGSDVVVPGAKIGEKEVRLLFIKDEDVLAVIRNKPDKK
jgi:chaperonin GroES